MSLHDIKGTSHQESEAMLNGVPEPFWRARSWGVTSWGVPSRQISISSAILWAVAHQVEAHMGWTGRVLSIEPLFGLIAAAVTAAGAVFVGVRCAGRADRVARWYAWILAAQTSLVAVLHLGSFASMGHTVSGAHVPISHVPAPILFANAVAVAALLPRLGHVSPRRPLFSAMAFVALAWGAVGGLVFVLAESATRWLSEGRIDAEVRRMRALSTEIAARPWPRLDAPAPAPRPLDPRVIRGPVLEASLWRTAELLGRTGDLERAYSELLRAATAHEEEIRCLAPCPEPPERKDNSTCLWDQPTDVVEHKAVKERLVCLDDQAKYLQVGKTYLAEAQSICDALVPPEDAPERTRTEHEAACAHKGAQSRAAGLTASCTPPPAGSGAEKPLSWVELDELIAHEGPRTPLVLDGSLIYRLARVPKGWAPKVGCAVRGGQCAEDVSSHEVHFCNAYASARTGASETDHLLHARVWLHYVQGARADRPPQMVYLSLLSEDADTQGKLADLLKKAPDFTELGWENQGARCLFKGVERVGFSRNTNAPGPALWLTGAFWKLPYGPPPNNAIPGCERPPRER